MAWISNGYTLRTVCFFLVLSVGFTTSLAPAVRAGNNTNSKLKVKNGQTSENVNVSQRDREGSLSVVIEAINRKDVVRKLKTLGFTVDEIEQRIKRLSDEELRSMAQRIEQVKAGGHLGVNELSLAMLIILIVLAPILAIAWLVLMIFGHEIHLHENGGLSHSH
jgi:hypothetical protein